MIAYYARTVNGGKNAEFPNLLYVTETPEIYRQIGMRALTMLMPQSHWCYKRQKEEILYFDKKRSRSLMRTLGVQFSNATHQTSFVHSIRRTQENVNTLDKDLTKYSERTDELSDREILADTCEGMGQAGKKYRGMRRKIRAHGEYIEQNIFYPKRSFTDESTGNVWVCKMDRL